MIEQARCASPRPRETMFSGMRTLEDLKARMILAAGVAARAFRDAHPKAFRWVAITSELQLSFDLVGRERDMAVATLSVSYANEKTGKLWREQVAEGSGGTIDLAFQALVSASDTWIFIRGGVEPEEKRESVIEHLTGDGFRVYVPPGLMRSAGSTGGDPN